MTRETPRQRWSVRISTLLSGPRRTAARATAILWTFGYSLVALLASVSGRGGLLLQMAIQTAFWLVAMTVAAALYAVWRRIAERRAMLKWPATAAACALAGLLVTVIDLATYTWITETWRPEWRSWTVVDGGRFGSVLILYTWTFALNAALFWTIDANEKAKAEARRAAEAEAAAQRAQLAALRLQLNPHFMFNTLNAISGLVLEGDRDGADAMISRLASFLRAAMSIDPNALTPLADEVSAVEAYLDIEAARFGERLRVEYDCPAALRTAHVPSLILQPLVENAIKFAVAPSRRPVTLRVVAQAARGQLHLSVTDDGAGEPSAAHSGGVGLANVRARLATLYGSRARLATRRLRPGFAATIALPHTRPAEIAA